MFIIHKEKDIFQVIERKDIGFEKINVFMENEVMDRFVKIKDRLLTLAKNDEDIKAIIFIGSSTRDTVKADEYSDLDVVIATQNPERWLYGDYPEQLGDVKISFVEPTLGGGKERRVLYAGSLDVDIIIFTPTQLEKAIKEGVTSIVMNRGYEVMLDTEGYSALLEENVSHEIKPVDLSEPEFDNMVNDFFFHTIWAYKKILRGELWTAKMCIDAYLKNYLLKIIEMYSVSKYHVDVWHNGRFLDCWAEKEILSDLEKCFAHYDREDMVSALLATQNLFGRLASQTAEMRGYKYPQEAEKYTSAFVKDYMGNGKMSNAIIDSFEEG